MVKKNELVGLLIFFLDNSPLRGHGQGVFCAYIVLIIGVPCSYHKKLGGIYIAASKKKQKVRLLFHNSVHVSKANIKSFKTNISVDAHRSNHSF